METNGKAAEKRRIRSITELPIVETATFPSSLLMYFSFVVIIVSYHIYNYNEVTIYKMESYLLDSIS
jgi:ABC-type uncharacterized transport system permease subunit